MPAYLFAEGQLALQQKGNYDTDRGDVQLLAQVGNPLEESSEYIKALPEHNVGKKPAEVRLSVLGCIPEEHGQPDHTLRPSLEPSEVQDAPTRRGSSRASYLQNAVEEGRGRGPLDRKRSTILGAAAAAFMGIQGGFGMVERHQASVEGTYGSHKGLSAPDGLSERPRVSFAVQSDTSHRTSQTQSKPDLLQSHIENLAGLMGSGPRASLTTKVTSLEADNTPTEPQKDQNHLDRLLRLERHLRNNNLRMTLVDQLRGHAQQDVEDVSNESEAKLLASYIFWNALPDPSKYTLPALVTSYAMLSLYMDCLCAWDMSQESS